MREKVEELVKKVIEMRFENTQFEQAASLTMKTLETLSGLFESLNTSTQGLERVSMPNLDASAASAQFSDLASNVNLVADGFSTMGIIGRTVIENLTDRVIDLGMEFVGRVTSMTSSILGMQSVFAGFAEYELKMGSVQTIMASTGESLETVNGYLDELNTYADKTIYSFSDMTSSIGKFTNAGVPLEQAVKAIQGISNEAAVSGANAEQASHAMYNFAQALSSGAVKLIDWKSIEVANMATQEFKQQLIDTAVELGTLTKKEDRYISTTTDANGKISDAFDSTHSFNESLSSQWMTTDVLVKTLGKYADETTDIGKKAFAAAQDVKTFSQMIDTMKESVGSGWTQTWEYVIGDLEEAKVLFTNISQGFDRIVGASSEARNAMMKFWHDNGGRDTLIKTLTVGFQNLATTFKPIKRAFSDVMPEFGEKRLLGMTEQLLNFTASLKPTEKVLYRIYHVSRFAWSGLDLLRNVFVGLGKAAKPVVTKVLSEGFDALEAACVKVNKSFKGFVGWLEHFTGLDLHVPTMEEFTRLGEYLCGVLDGMKEKFAETRQRAGEFLGSLADGKFQKFFEDIGNSASTFLRDLTLDDIKKKLDNARQSVVKFFGSFKVEMPTLHDFWSLIDWVATGVWNLGEKFQNARTKVSDFFSSFKIPDALKAHQSKLWLNQELSDETEEAAENVETNTSRTKKAFDYLIMALDFVIDAAVHVAHRLADIFKPVWDMLLGGIKDVIGETKNMTLLDIMKVFTVFLSHNMYTTISSTLDAIGSFTTSISSITRGINKMFGKGNKILDDLRVTLGAFQVSINAKALVDIAIAVGILAGSVIALSMIDTSAGLDALFVISVLVGEMLGAMKLLSNVGKASSGLTINLAPLMTIAVATVILAAALTNLSKLDMNRLGVGILGVTALVWELVGVALVLGKWGQKFGKGSASLLVMAFAVSKLAGVVAKMADMENGKALQGLNVVGSLLIMLTAFAAATKNGKAGAAAVGASVWMLAVGIKSLAGTIDALGQMDTGELIKGGVAIGVLAAALVGFAYALIKAPVTKLPVFGAGLMLIAVGMAALATSAFLFSRFSWTSLAKAGAAIGGLLLAFALFARFTPIKMVALAAGLTVMSVALLGLAIDLKVLASLGIPGLLISLGALAGVLTILGVAGTLLAPMIPTLLALAGTVALFGAAILALGVGSVSLAAGLAALGPGLISAAIGVGAALGMFLASVLEGAAEILNALALLGDALAQAFIAIGKALMVTIITLAGPLSDALYILCITLLESAIKYWDPLIDAIVNFLDKFMDSLTDEILPAIEDWLWKLVVAAADLLLRIVEGILGSIPGIGGAMQEAVKDLRDNMNEYWDNVLDARRLNRKTDRKMKQLQEGLNQSASRMDIPGAGENGAASYADAFLETLDDRIPAVGDAAEAVPEAVRGGFLSRSGSFANVGDEAGTVIGDSLVGSLSDFKMGAGDAGGEIADEAMAGIADNITSAFGSIGAEAFAQGENFGEGYFDGLLSTKELIGEGAGSLGTSSVEELMAVIDAHSPSRLAAFAGQMFGQGYLDGLSGYERPSFLAARGIGLGTVSGLQDPLSYLDQLLDDTFNLDPTITPILDMTNVDDGMWWLRQEFARQPELGVNGAWTPDMTNARIVAENTRPDTGTEDLIEEIGYLREDVVRMGEAIGKIKMVMDTGAIVGEMEAPMDEALGRRTSRSIRTGRR